MLYRKIIETGAGANRENDSAPAPVFFSAFRRMNAGSKSDSHRNAPRHDGARGERRPHLDCSLDFPANNFLPFMVVTPFFLFFLPLI